MPDKNVSETSIDKNFTEVISILNSNNIPYWVCHGTLLGLIRDKKLIPWDHDIDIAVWDASVTKEEIINLMLTKGYILKNDGDGYDFLYFTKHGGREVDFNFYKVSNDKIMAYSEWFIQRSRIAAFCGFLSNPSVYIGRHKKIIRYSTILSPFFRQVVIFMKKKNLFYKSAGYTTPVKLLSKFMLLECCNLKIRVPCLYEEVLEYVYGKTWHIPKQQYDWTKESPSTRISKDKFN